MNRDDQDQQHRAPNDRGGGDSDAPDVDQPQRIVEVAQTDGVLLKTGVVNHMEGPSGESVGVTEEDKKRITAEIRPGGSVESEVKTPVRRGEEGTLEVCRILIRRLNADGASWSDPFDRTKASDDVDCEAHDSSARLGIQVVRAREKGFWRKLAQSGEVVESTPVDEAADAMRMAIGEKEDIPPAQRPALLLALDAQDTPGQVLQAVVESFRNRHGQSVQVLGFAAIWVVGPTPDLCHRLDVLPG